MRKKSVFGVIASVLVLIFFFAILMFSSTSSGFKDCYTGTTNLVGNGTVASPPGTDTTLFAKFQAQPSFSNADREEQRKDAALIVSIGQARPEKFKDRDIAIAEATAIHESNLINLPFQGKANDHTSLGLFQQQVSVKTYGTAAQIMDPVHAINAFYDRLAGVAHRDNMAMIDVAIKIQIPNQKAYHARWKWDDLANEIVNIYKQKGSAQNLPVNSVNVCAQFAGVFSTGTAHLPLDPGYHVSDGFADPRPDLSIGSKPHIGIDMVYGSNTRGKPVYAALSGVVVQSGFGGGCNKSNNNPVMILSADGLEIGYLHMNGADIIVKKGDHVAAGQQIGAIGSCGQSTGPHLHFEVTPVSDHDAWLSTVKSVQKYGSTWLDPEGILAHYGVKLLP